MTLAGPFSSILTDNWRYPPHNGTLLLKITRLITTAPFGIQEEEIEFVRSLDMSSQGDPEASSVAPFLYIDGMPISESQLVYAGVIVMITAILLVTSVLTITVILSNEHLRDVTGYYLISLAVSDLLTALLITPLSIYAALDQNWRFGMPAPPTAPTPNLAPIQPSEEAAEEGRKLSWGERNSWVCKTEAYVGVMLWSSIVYTFMWVGVDRFAALNKPSRYDCEQTFTRCKCWIMFTWVTSLLLSCPILAAQMEAKYYPEAFLCILDWGATKAYSATLAVLVVTPSLVIICYTYRFIFASIRNPEELEDSQKMLLDTDQTFMMSFFVILAFALSWAPWFALRAYETLTQEELRIQPLQFSLMWLAVAGGCWKLLIYTITNREFRRGLVSTLGMLCCGCCSRTHPPSRERSEYEVISAAQTRYHS